MNPDSVRLATLAADGRLDTQWPGRTGLLSAVRDLVGERERSSPYAESAPTERALSALLTIATWAAVIRTGTALLAFLFRREAIPDGRIPVEAHVLMVLVLGGAGLVLLYGGQRETRSRALGMMFVLLASSFTPRMLAGLAATPLISLAVPVVARLPTEAMFAAAGWLFAYSFPSAPSGRPVQRMCLLMAWVGAILGLVLLGMNVGGTLFPDATWAKLAYHQRPGRNIFWMVLNLVAAPSLPVILWKARTVNVIERQRVRRFAAGMIVGLLPSTILLLALVLVPSIRPHMETYAKEYGLLFYGGLLTIPFSTGYAIKASRVLPARLVFRGALVGSMARSSLILLVALPMVWLAIEVRRSATITIGQFLAGPGVAAALALAAMGALLLFVRPQVLNIIERLFERRRTDVARSLAAATGSIRTAVGPRELSHAVRNCLSDAFGTSKVTILLGALTSPVLSPIDERHQTELMRTSAIASLLETEPVPIIVAGPSASRCIRLLPDHERFLLASSSAEVVCAIPNTTGRLLGVVMVGPKANEQPYSTADLENIATLCATAGIAVETRFLGETAVETDARAAVECAACGQVFESTTTGCGCGGRLLDSRVPSVVSGRYRVKRRVGAGGMGVVYEGVDVALGRKVALKALPAVNRAEAERLAREARVMASLSHPNIAFVYGLEFWRDIPILVMEFMTRGTLADALSNDESFSTSRLASIEFTLRAALEHLHSKGLIHRDVKPSNVGVREDYSAALLDFGINIRIQDNRESALAGTLAYLSPDVIHGEPQSPLSDIWALERVINELQQSEA